MKSTIIVLNLLLIATTVLKSQNHIEKAKSEKAKAIYIGIGAGEGFIYPNAINDYLKEYYTSGETIQLFLQYYCIHASVSYFPVKSAEIAFETQYAFNTVSGQGDDNFFLSRLTPALKLNYHIPLGQKTSYFLGAGLNYSSITFNTPVETFKENTFGISFDTGIMLRLKRIAFKPGLTFNIIKAKTNTNEGHYDNTKGLPSELSFTGGHVFFTFQF